MAEVLVQDASLQAIADAIRGKNGGITPYLPSQMAAAIAEIETGGGITLQLTELCTLASDMTRKQFLTAFPIPITYKNGSLLLVETGDNPSTTATIRMSNYSIWFHENNASGGFLYNYANGSVAPNDLRNTNTVSCGNSAYCGVENGHIVATGTTNNEDYVFAAGNKVYYLDLPVLFRNGGIDTTLWDA